jgi:hypothetical protein
MSTRPAAWAASRPSPISAPTQLKNIAEPIRVYSLEVGKPMQAKPPGPRKRSALAQLAAGIAASFIVIAAGAWHSFTATRQRFSIVVLPFANLSGDPAQDCLADALTDVLTTSIARMPFTFVIARNTAFTFKGKPVDGRQGDRQGKLPHSTISGRERAPKTHEKPSKGCYFGTVLVP